MHATEEQVKVCSDAVSSRKDLVPDDFLSLPRSASLNHRGNERACQDEWLLYS